MPLTLFLVSSLLLLCIVVGGIVAYLGVHRAVDGFEDEHGFHPVADGVTRTPDAASPVRSDSGDAVSARV